MEIWPERLKNYKGTSKELKEDSEEIELQLLKKTKK